jgi:hypothetical protein
MQVGFVCKTLTCTCSVLSFFVTHLYCCGTEY